MSDRNSPAAPGAAQTGPRHPARLPIALGVLGGTLAVLPTLVPLFANLTPDPNWGAQVLTLSGVLEAWAPRLPALTASTLAAGLQITILVLAVRAWIDVRNGTDVRSYPPFDGSRPELEHAWRAAFGPNGRWGLLFAERKRFDAGQVAEMYERQIQRARAGLWTSAAFFSSQFVKPVFLWGYLGKNRPPSFLSGLGIGWSLVLSTALLIVFLYGYSRLRADIAKRDLLRKLHDHAEQSPQTSDPAPESERSRSPEDSRAEEFAA